MPYQSPTWINGSAPPLSAENLQELTDAVEALDENSLLKTGGSLTGEVVAMDSPDEASAQVRNSVIVSSTVSDEDIAALSVPVGTIIYRAEEETGANSIALHNATAAAHQNMLVDGNNTLGADDSQSLEEHMVNPAAHQNLWIDGNAQN